jgi:hypothetical protein
MDMTMQDVLDKMLDDRERAQSCICCFPTMEEHKLNLSRALRPRANLGVAREPFQKSKISRSTTAGN